MRNIETSVYETRDSFQVTSRALLHGYRAKAKADESAETISAQERNHRVMSATNVIVVGTTSGAARAYVEQALRNDPPSNIICIGLDTPVEELERGIDGHMILMEDLDHVSDQRIIRIAEFVVKATHCAYYQRREDHQQQGLKVHIFGRSLEVRVLSALFEQWQYETYLKTDGKYGCHLHKPWAKYTLDRMDFSADHAKAPNDAVLITFNKIAQVLGETKKRIKPDETPVLLSPDLSVFNAQTLYLILHLLGDRDIWIPKELTSILFHDAITHGRETYLDYQVSAEECDKIAESDLIKIPVTAL